jgi:hypothetical protein
MRPHSYIKDTLQQILNYESNSNLVELDRLFQYILCYHSGTFNIKFNLVGISILAHSLWKMYYLNIKNEIKKYTVLCVENKTKIMQPVLKNAVKFLVA